MKGNEQLSIHAERGQPLAELAADPLQVRARDGIRYAFNLGSCHGNRIPDRRQEPGSTV